MGQTDIITIVVFTLIVFISGLTFSGSGKNIKSFFAAGGAVPWWINGLSLFMSFFSAGTFVVWGSIAYSHGWVSITIQWTMAIAGFIIGFVFAPKWHETKATTAAEFITNRLGNKTQSVYTITFLFISIFTTGAFLYPVAKIVEVSTGFPITWCIIGLGLLIIIYTSVGGLWAVVVTDVLQFIVLTAAVLIVVPLAFTHIGGVGKLLTASPEGFFNLFNDEYTGSFMLAFGMYNLFFIAGNWAYVQRYTSVKTKRDAKKVGWLFGSLYLISPIIWMLPPMVYRIMNPELAGNADEGAYIMVSKAVLPAGMLGLIVGGMIFATSSSVNTTLNIAAGVFTNDIYKNFYKNASVKNLMRVARLATLAFGVLTILIAIMIQDSGGIVNFVFTLGAITGGALYLPPLWALFSKRHTGKTILATTFISLAVNLFFKFAAPLLFDITLNRANEMILGVSIPVLCLLLFELVNAHRNQENPEYINYQRILSDKNAIEVTDEDEAIEAKDNSYGIKVIAIGTSLIGVLIVTLGILARTGAGIVIGIGALVVSLGIYIFFKNK